MAVREIEAQMKIDMFVCADVFVYEHFHLYMYRYTHLSGAMWAMRENQGQAQEGTVLIARLYPLVPWGITHKPLDYFEFGQG